MVLDMLGYLNGVFCLGVCIDLEPHHQDGILGTMSFVFKVPPDSKGRDFLLSDQALTSTAASALQMLFSGGSPERG